MDSNLVTRLAAIREQLEACKPDDIVHVPSLCGTVSTHKTVREWLVDLRYAEQALTITSSGTVNVGGAVAAAHRHVKCSRCGWVHVALTVDEIQRFAATPEEQDQYRRCSGPMCGANPAAFVPARENDAPVLATIPGCIISPH
jgi:rubredoxin